MYIYIYRYYIMILYSTYRRRHSLSAHTPITGHWPPPRWEWAAHCPPAPGEVPSCARDILEISDDFKCSYT